MYLEPTGKDVQYSHTSEWDGKPFTQKLHVEFFRGETGTEYALATPEVLDLLLAAGGWVRL
jgi:hypothetical protein